MIIMYVKCTTFSIKSVHYTIIEKVVDQMYCKGKT